MKNTCRFILIVWTLGLFFSMIEFVIEPSLPWVVASFSCACCLGYVNAQYNMLK